MENFDNDYAQHQPMSLVDGLLQIGMELFGSYLSRVVQAPTHRLTVLMMVEGELCRQRRLPTGGFRGLLGCAKRTYLYDGPMSFFRGVGTEWLLMLPTTLSSYAATQLVTLIAQSTINFAAMSETQQMVASVGFTALLEQLSAIVQDPISTITTTLIGDVVPEVEGGTFEFTGPIAVIKSIYKAKGLLGFYQGFATPALLSISYRMSYSWLLHTVFSLLTEEQQQKHGLTFARAISLVSGLLGQPVEVVRRRLQLAAHTDMPYRSALHCIQTIIAEEGVLGLWAGYKIRALVTVFGFAMADGLGALQKML